MNKTLEYQMRMQEASKDRNIKRRKQKESFASKGVIKSNVLILKEAGVVPTLPGTNTETDIEAGSYAYNIIDSLLFFNIGRTIIVIPPREILDNFTITLQTVFTINSNTYREIGIFGRGFSSDMENFILGELPPSITLVENKLVYIDSTHLEWRLHAINSSGENATVTITMQKEGFTTDVNVAVRGGGGPM